jgi:hypothetical protein
MNSASLTRGVVCARLLSAAQYGSRASAWTTVLHAQRIAEEYAGRVMTLVGETVEPRP